MSTLTPTPPETEQTAEQPDNRSFMRGPVGRVIFVALLAEIGYAVLNISTMPVYLKYDRHFGEGMIGVVLVAFLMSEAIFKGPMGHRADRFGAKSLMTIGPLISVGTSMVSLIIPRMNGAAPEVLLFIMLRAFDGLGAAMMWPAAYAYVGESAGDQNRQRAMSYLNACYMIGIAVALPIGGFVNDLTHTRWASMILAAGLFLSVAGVVHFMLPTTHVHAVEGEHATGLEDLKRSVRAIPMYLIISVVTFAGIGFPMAIIKLFAYDQFKMTESSFGLLVLPAALAMAGLSGTMGRLGERLGRVRSVHVGMGLCSIGVSLIATGAIIPIMRTPLVLAAGGLPVGIGFLLAIPAWMASVSDVDAKHRGANLGAVMTAQGVGAIIGAPIGAAFYEKLKPIGIKLNLGVSFAHYMPFVGCAACVTAGWLLSLRILRK
jgi:MFS family permease